MDRKESRKLTKKKRKSQSCKTYEVKVDKSKLSTEKQDYLKLLFLEAKWFYNFCLSQEDVFKSDTTLYEIPVMNKDKEFENRELKVLSSQMKQSIRTRIKGSILALSTLKKKGKKVGRLKFKSRVESIPLVQYDKTYFINFENNTIKIQGFKPTFKVIGLEQLPKDCEIANATIIKKCDDYYFKITTYQEKQIKDIPEGEIAIDFGCDTQLTFDNGIKIEFDFPVTRQIKRLDRKIMKGNRKKSNNKWKDQKKREKLYERLVNQKKDVANKIVHAITTNYDVVIFQDESIKAWQHGTHGKKITNTAIGGIMRDLKTKSHTPIEVNKFFPSTQTCPICGCTRPMELKDREFECYACGYVEDRDIKSAICIKQEGLKQIPMDYRFKLEENSSSTRFYSILSQINGIKVSKKSSSIQEASGLDPR